MKNLTSAVLIAFLTVLLAGCGETQTTREIEIKTSPDKSKSVEKETTVKTDSDGTKTETKTEVKTEVKKTEEKK